MNWTLAIERNRDALLRIVETLFDIVGMAENGSALTLSRCTRNYVLRILRPAESAARRLIVVAARGIEIVVRPAFPLRGSEGRGETRGSTPGRSKADAPRTARLIRVGARSAEAGGSSLPPRSVTLRTPVAGLPARGRLGASATDSAGPHTAMLSLIDRRKRFDLRPRRRYATAAPRLRSLSDRSLPVYMREPEPPARHVPAPDDELDAGPVCRRLAALKRALDDLDGHARRLVRIEARRKAGLLRTRRYEPLRPGWPPGRRKRRIHEIDAILGECHSLAVHALKQPDSG